MLYCAILFCFFFLSTSFLAKNLIFSLRSISLEHSETLAECYTSPHPFFDLRTYQSMLSNLKNGSLKEGLRFFWNAQETGTTVTDLHIVFHAPKPFLWSALKLTPSGFVYFTYKRRDSSSILSLREKISSVIWSKYCIISKPAVEFLN